MSTTIVSESFFDIILILNHNGLDLRCLLLLILTTLSVDTPMKIRGFGAKIGQLSPNLEDSSHRPMTQLIQL